MANEVTYTGKGDLMIAAALSLMLTQTFVDRTDLVQTATYGGSINGQGSTATKFSKITLDDAMGAANTDEVTAVANTDFATAAITVTVARQALTRGVSDLYGVVSKQGPGVQALAEDMAGAAVLRTTDMICALFGSLSTSVNDTGLDFTVDTLYDGIYALIRAGSGGQMVAVLSPVQFTDFVNSLRGEGQSLVPADAASLLTGIGSREHWGLEGSFGGVQIWKCDSVNTSGSDHVGAIYTKNCFIWQDGVPQSAMMAAAPGSYIRKLPNGSSIFVELERNGKSAITDITGNLFFGVSELDDAQGVKLISSAT